MMRRLLIALAACLLPAQALAVCATDAYSTAVCVDTPCHYYRMDAPSGTTETDRAASCGEGQHDMNYQNSPTLNQTGALTGAGITDASVLFTRASSQNATDLDAQNSANPDYVAGHYWEVEGWVKFTSLDFAAFVSSDNNTTFYWRLGYSTLSSTWQFLFHTNAAGCNGSGAYGNIGSGAPSTGVWYYVVGQAVSAGATSLSSMTLYVNAVQNSTTTSFSGATCGAAGFFNIGGRRASFYLNGNVDEVALYSSQLTTTRILAHYNAGISGAGAFPWSVKRPSLPRFRNDDYLTQFVSRGYNTGHFTSREIQPQVLNVGFLPFSVTPWGNVGQR